MINIDSSRKKINSAFEPDRLKEVVMSVNLNSHLLPPHMKADKTNVVVKDNTDIAALSHPFRMTT